MPALTITDFVLTGVGKPGQYVQLRENATPTNIFTSANPTDSNGQFSIGGSPPPPADYSAYTSPLLGAGAIWTLYDPHFRIGYTRGDTILAAVQAITEATLVAGLDASLGEVVTVTLTADRVVGLPINPAIGQTLELIVTQGGAGNFRLTWPAGIKTAWRPAAAAGAISSLTLRYYGTNWQQKAGQIAVSDTGVAAHAGPMVVGSLTVRDPASASPYAAVLPGDGVTPTPSGVQAGKQYDFGGSEFNVLNYGAGDSSVISDSTVAINNAMTAAHNAFVSTGASSRLWLPPQPNGYVIKRQNAADQSGGGILWQSGVSIYGNRTKLLLRANCSFVSTRGLHNLAGQAGATVTDISADVAYGATQLTVTSSTGFVAGHDCYLTVNQNRYDVSSQGYSFWAQVKSVDDATHITIDRPILSAMFVSAQAAPVLADGGAGALPAGDYTIGYTYVIGGVAAVGGLETEISATAVQTIAASHLITPTPIAPPTGCTGVKWYIVSNTAGATNGLVATRTDGTGFNINVQGSGVVAPDKSIALSGTPGGGLAGFRWIADVDAVVQDVEIDGFDLINDTANSGNAEFTIDLRYCKNVRHSRITGQDGGSGFLAANCEQVSGSMARQRQVGAQGGSSKGRLIGGWNQWGTIYDNVHVEKFDGVAVFCENYSRQVLIRKLHVVMNTVNTRQSPIIVLVGQESEVHIDGMILEGLGGTVGGQAIDVFNTGGTTSFLTVENLEVRTATDIRSLSLINVTGKLILGPQSPVAGHYNEIKRFSKRFELTPNMSVVDIGLPAGLLRRCRIFVSSMTGLTGFRIGNTGGGQNSSQLTGTTPALQAGVFVDFTNLLCSLGTNNPPNNGGIGKKTVISTDGTMTPGAYGIIELEYFVKATDFPTSLGWATADDATKGIIQDGYPLTLVPGNVSTISVGASAFTYTNNDGVLEAVYVLGGTVSLITKNGLTLATATSATLPLTFIMAPGESLIVTYSVAPSMWKDRL